MASVLIIPKLVKKSPAEEQDLKNINSPPESLCDQSSASSTPSVLRANHHHSSYNRSINPLAAIFTPSASPRATICSPESVANSPWQQNEDSKSSSSDDSATHVEVDARPEVSMPMAYSPLPMPTSHYIPPPPIPPPIYYAMHPWIPPGLPGFGHCMGFGYGLPGFPPPIMPPGIPFYPPPHFYTSSFPFYQEKSVNWIELQTKQPHIHNGHARRRSRKHLRVPSNHLVARPSGNTVPLDDTQKEAVSKYDEPFPTTSAAISQQPVTPKIGLTYAAVAAKAETSTKPSTAKLQDSHEVISVSRHKIESQRVSVSDRLKHSTRPPLDAPKCPLAIESPSWGQSRRWTSQEKIEMLAFQKMRINLRFMGANNSPFVPQTAAELTALRASIAEESKERLATEVGRLVAQCKHRKDAQDQEQAVPSKLMKICGGKSFDDQLSLLFAANTCFQSSTMEISSNGGNNHWPSIAKLKEEGGKRGVRREFPSPKKGFIQDAERYSIDVFGSRGILTVDILSRRKENCTFEIETEKLPVYLRKFIESIDG